MDEGCVIAQKDSTSPALLPRSLCLDFLMWLVPWDHLVYSYLFCFSRQGLLKVPLAPSRNFAYCIHCLSLCPLFLNPSPRFTTADSVQTNHLLWWSCIFLMDRTSLLALLPRHQVLLYCVVYTDRTQPLLSLERVNLAFAQGSPLSADPRKESGEGPLLLLLLLSWPLLIQVLCQKEICLVFLTMRVYNCSCLLFDFKAVVSANALRSSNKESVLAY